MVEDFLPINDWDHVEFYVANARQASYFYSQTLGMDVTAYSGLETGNRDRASYVLECDKIRFVLSTAYHPEHPIAQFALKHGDGVKDIALTVPNAERAYEEATKRGAVGVMEPIVFEDQYGRVKRATIALYGDVVHSFIERNDYAGPFLPGYQKYESPWPKSRVSGLRAIDHIVANVELGEMDEWVRFYERVMGFQNTIHFTDDAISTDYSALMSKVMQGGHGKVKFPINEPADSKLKGKSQITEYLEYNHGPGAQHIALITGNIIETVRHLRSVGMDFIPAISSYYEDLEARVGKIDEDIESLKELGILVDRDEDGYLLQIFTRNAQDRPTLFFEVIQRKGARGFGAGNFKALFEAIEREQSLRGNL
jgi:4-hydroxyphenylpyruvate dioxygenase